MEFDNEFKFDTEESELKFPTPVIDVTTGNTDLNKANVIENLMKKYRENSNLPNIIDDTKDMEEDVIRDITSIVNRKVKTLPDDDEEEKYDFKNVLSQYDNVTSFIDMKLSKPILKSLNESEIHSPTPIQAACIPQAMLRKDICACAKTGSGKTIAFLVPIVERLLRFPSQHGNKYVNPRAVILSPTRELALQTYEVATKLLKYCPRLSIQLVSGGLNRTAQEVSLRNGADVVIATPGRLIDLMHNTANFDLRKIEVLVLDEADKMLDDQFIDQIAELVKGCSPTRQVLLFSATMTENVRSLTSLSLKDPIKVFISTSMEVADNLVEEVVRVRSTKAADREALLMALICRGFSKRTIVFLPTKNQCHRIHVMLGLLGVRSAELHSNMSQIQRLEALGRFGRAGTSEENRLDVLVGTDLASRGLDIVDVETVINYSLPKTAEQYVHRVGRTARNTKTGRAISLVAEDERAMLKKICKMSPQGVKMRKIDQEVIEYYSSKVRELDGVVKEMIETERAEKEAAIAELELEKAQRRCETGGEEDKAKRFNWFAGQDASKKKKHVKRRRGGDDDDDDEDRRSKRPRKDGADDRNKGRAFSKKKMKEEKKAENKRKTPKILKYKKK